MDLKKTFFLIFLIGIIFFPFLFSKKEIKFEKTIHLPNFIIKNGSFETYNQTIEKKGSFVRVDFYNKSNYKSDNLEIKFFDKNSSLKAQKMVYDGVYTFFNGNYKTKDYLYTAQKSIYKEKLKKLISYNFEFFNNKLDGKGSKMVYQNKIIKADNIHYTIKDLNE